MHPGVASHRRRLAAAAPVSGEPIYNAGTDTLLWSDDFNSYANVAALTDAGAGFRTWCDDPSNTTRYQLVAGESGGQAIRFNYSGVSQDAGNFRSRNMITAGGLDTVYMEVRKRYLLSAPIGNLTFASKDWELFDAVGRVQFSFSDHLPAPSDPASRHTYGECLDNANTDPNCLYGTQPQGPWFNSDNAGSAGYFADGNWHTFKYEYRCNTSGTAGATTSRDGFAGWWIDGVPIVQIRQSLVGVLAAETGRPWCSQQDVDMISVNTPHLALAWPSAYTGDYNQPSSIEYDLARVWKRAA